MKLDHKELILKSLKRQTFSIVTATSASTTLANNGSAWVTVKPTLTGGQKIVAPVGYYQNGLANVYLYSYRPTADRDGATVALYNQSGTSKTGTVSIDFLIVEE